MGETHFKGRLSNFIIALLLLFPILINSVKVFGNLILLILVILGAYIAITERKNPFQVKELKVFSWLTVSYFGVMLLSGVIADGLNYEFHHLGRKLHFLLAPLIALAIFQVDLPLKKLLLSIKLGLIVIGVITLVQRYFPFGEGQVSGMINSNVFGDIAVAMLFLSIIQVFIEAPKERVFTLITTVFGIIAIVLSNSRGSWLSFLILSIVYIGLIYKPFLQNSSKRKTSLVLLFLIVSVVVGTQTNIDKRFDVAISNVQNWHSDAVSHTSAGLRMQMWESGLDAAKKAPWFGYGYRNANQVVSEYIMNKRDKRAIANHTHLHNEYITNLVSAGIVGLLSLLILLFTPMVIFYQKLKDEKNYYYASMGILLCVGYATFGFTHIAFGEEHINAFYVLFMGFLLPKTIKTTAN